MTTFDWDQSDRFISNYGDGPLMARILSVENGVAKMERWHKADPAGTTTFLLPIKDLFRDTCGWKKDSNADYV